MAISIAPINSRHFEVIKILGPIFSTQGYIKKETVNRENQGQTYIPTAVCVYIIGLQKTHLEVVQHWKQEINKIEKKELRLDKYNPTKNFDFELSYNLFNKIQYRNFIPIVFNVLFKRLQQKETSIYIHTKSLYTSTNTKTIKFTLIDIFFVYRPAGSWR